MRGLVILDIIKNKIAACGGKRGLLKQPVLDKWIGEELQPAGGAGGGAELARQIIGRQCVAGKVDRG